MHSPSCDCGRMWRPVAVAGCGFDASDRPARDHTCPNLGVFTSLKFDVEDVAYPGLAACAFQTANKPYESYVAYVTPEGADHMTAVLAELGSDLHSALPPLWDEAKRSLCTTEPQESKAPSGGAPQHGRGSGDVRHP